MKRAELQRKTPLQRTTPLKAHPRSKGNRAEREVIDTLRQHGWSTARRNFQSGGQGGGDIIEGPPGFSIEIKHQERCSIWAWIEQCEEAAAPTETPLVVFRRNRSRWYAVIPLDDLLPMIEAVTE